MTGLNDYADPLDTIDIVQHQHLLILVPVKLEPLGLILQIFQPLPFLPVSELSHFTNDDIR